MVHIFLLQILLILSNKCRDVGGPHLQLKRKHEDQILDLQLNMVYAYIVGQHNEQFDQSIRVFLLNISLFLEIVLQVLL